MASVTMNGHKRPGPVITCSPPLPAVVAVDEIPGPPSAPVKGVVPPVAPVVTGEPPVAPEVPRRGPRPMPPPVTLQDLIVPLGASVLAGMVGLLTRHHHSPAARVARGLAAGMAHTAWWNVTAFRAWQTHWGATKDEVLGTLPGDDVLSHCESETTRAITINAPPEQIWPWLVQMGYGRGGWYSYDKLDNGDQPSAEAILPECQYIKVGDVLPAGPDDAPGFQVVALEPSRALVLRMTYEFGAYAGDLVWVFALVPVDAIQTRLLIRSHFASKPALLSRIANGITGTVPIDFVMTRKQLKEIKRRVEMTA